MTLGSASREVFKADYQVSPALIALWAVLGGPRAVLPPRLDRRARQILASETPVCSHLHRAYIILEGVKVVLLPALEILLTVRLPA